MLAALASKYARVTPPVTVAQMLAEHLGTSTEDGGQVMDAVMQADCPNLMVGAVGVAR